MVQRWSSGVNLIRPLFTYLREVRLLPCSYATRTTTSTCSSPDKERRVTHRLGRDGREHARRSDLSAAERLRNGRCINCDGCGEGLEQVLPTALPSSAAHRLRTEKLTRPGR